MNQPRMSLATPALRDVELTTIAKIVLDESGIILSESKKNLIVSRLGKRLRELELPDFGAYCDLLKGPSGQEERKALISAITTNVTSFFREAHHFESLRKDVLPPLLDAARRGARVRLWSAGCSTGEEPYSIAMTLLELLPEAARLDVLVLATDIDANVVEHAKAGRYRQDQLKGISAAQKAKFFVEGGDGTLRVTDDLKKIIFFETLNLHSSWPFNGAFDAIFCRNVTIYFDAETQAKLWQRFAEKLTADGHLFIGHSERVDGGATKMLRLVGQTHYHKIKP